MSYFNHAFEKMFLGKSGTQATSGTPGDPGASVEYDAGFIEDAGIATQYLNSKTAAEGYQLGVGTYGFFDPKTNLSVTASGISDTCCPLYLAGASILTNDKIGKFAGGYTETNKSKIINPKFVHKYWRVDPCTPQNAIVHLGSTPATATGGIATIGIAVAGTTYTNGSYTAVAVASGSAAGTGATFNITVAGGIITVATVNNPGIGYLTSENALVLDTVAAGMGAGDGALRLDVLTLIAPEGTNCCKEFLCNETYNLRLDIKGSPALRYLTRNTYYTSGAYTGCCADATVAPTPVDSTLVFIAWAKDFARSPLINPFIKMIVYDETGVPWFQDAALAQAAGYPATQIWDNYVSGGHINDACAGMVFIGAYVDTKFGDCTFYPTDYYEKEPVRIYPSEVDLNGAPCEFTGLCVYTECNARQGMGFGETVLRSLILSESYRQNFFATNNDLRIREITQGYDISNAVDRSALYTCYYIQHTVPRYNNPSGVFDNDQYLLMIAIPEPDPANPTGSPALETFLSTWLGNCGACETLQEFTCDACDSVISYL